MGSGALAGGGSAEGEPWALVWAGAGVLAGVAVAAVGVTGLRHGMAWPAMGSAYERRRPVEPGRSDRPDQVRGAPDGGRDQAGDRAGEKNTKQAGEQASEQASEPASDQDMWDALDRRIDPTGDNTSRMED
jgi:hypothetical protein